MDQLWAPWRAEYIESSADTVLVKDSCVFCEIQSPGDDRARLVVHKGLRTQVVLNRFPYNNGHLLVMPKVHLGSLGDLDDETFTELHVLLRTSVSVVESAFKPDGLNVGLNLGRVAGAGVPGHLHYHVVPRWNGDTNFMPVVGLTRVISQHLLETYDRLKPLF